MKLSVADRSCKFQNLTLSAVETVALLQWHHCTVCVCVFECQRARGRRRHVCTPTLLAVAPNYHHDHLLNAASATRSEPGREGAQGKEGLLS